MWYEVDIRPDDNDTWLVTATAFDEVVSFGDDTESALRNVRDAIEEAIAGRIARGEDIPFPMREAPSKGHFVQMPVMVILKAGLHMQLRSQGWTRADLKRALGCQREHVDRLFRLDHNSKMDSIEAAFTALGVTLEVNVPALKAA
uniref:type II toxin-antitoxin system HicB family antitoxin n=1 Tax=Pararhizobium sp. IMCC3301 TaxID=3067904 RepID=UPI002740F01F|nr:type II toxin-antitoxin system HicB family antitoxin [Pararhizobium sp. IMCC3301]